MIRLYITSNSTQKKLDISSLVTSVTYTTSIDFQPSKLTLNIKKDPNKLLKVSICDVIQFWNDENEVFYGYVFTIRVDGNGDYELTTYDQTRYFYNHDFYTAEENSLWYIFWYICENVGVKYDSTGASKTPCVTANFMDKSYFDIFKESMAQSERYLIETSLGNELIGARPKYYIHDDFGTVKLTNILNNVDKSITLGTNSLVTDYTYEVNIDDGVYNEIYAVVNAKNSEGDKLKDTTGAQVKTLIGAKQNSESVKKWGILRKIVTVNDAKDYSTDEGKTELENYISTLLDESCQANKSFKLSAVGVDGVYAGSVVRIELERLNVVSLVYVVSAEHNYADGKHTMELEVSALQRFKEDNI